MTISPIPVMAGPLFGLLLGSMVPTYLADDAICARNATVVHMLHVKTNHGNMRTVTQCSDGTIGVDRLDHDESIAVPVEFRIPVPPQQHST